MSEIVKTDMETLYPLIESVVSGGGSVKIKVTGYSMYPLISSHRDSVVLTKAEKIKKGDVPLYRRENGEYILHRLVGEKDGAYKARGDYEQKIEYPVYPNQVVAVATGFYRKGRYISCDSVLYKLYKVFWMNTAWLRPFFLKVIAIIVSKKKKKIKKEC